MKSRSPPRRSGVEPERAAGRKRSLRVPGARLHRLRCKERLPHPPTPRSPALAWLQDAEPVPASMCRVQFLGACEHVQDARPLLAAGEWPAPSRNLQAFAFFERD